MFKKEYPDSTLMPIILLMFGMKILKSQKLLILKVGYEMTYACIIYWHSICTHGQHIHSHEVKIDSE